MPRVCGGLRPGGPVATFIRVPAEASAAACQGHAREFCRVFRIEEPKRIRFFGIDELAFVIDRTYTARFATSPHRGILAK